MHSYAASPRFSERSAFSPANTPLASARAAARAAAIAASVRSPTGEGSPTGLQAQYAELLGQADAVQDPSEGLDEYLSQGDTIKVLVRLRPLLDGDFSAGLGPKACIVRTSHTALTVFSPPRSQQHEYDYIAGDNTAQQTVFEVAGRPLVRHFIGGYNATVLAYGQTGAGKTWTMFGGSSPEDQGLVPRIVESLFTQIEAASVASASSPGGSPGAVEGGRMVGMHMWMSCVEIYSECISDLLDPSSSHLVIREDKRAGMYVGGVVEQPVESAEEAMDMLMRAVANRKRGHTKLNRESSRSHMVITFVLERQARGEDGQVAATYSRLNLVDLAGSERQKVSGAGSNYGERLREVAAINKSLSTLGKVIMSLVENQRGRNHHVPYRDSKLTYLLQDSLGGNSKTVIIANVSPSATCMAESLTTLRFAQRAKSIRNAPVANLSCRGAAVAEAEALRLEMERIKQEYVVFKSEQIEGSSKLQETQAVVSEQQRTLLEQQQELAFLRQELEAVQRRNAAARAAGAAARSPSPSSSSAAIATRASTAAVDAVSHTSPVRAVNGDLPAPEVSTSPRLPSVSSSADRRARLLELEPSSNAAAGADASPAVGTDRGPGASPSPSPGILGGRGLLAGPPRRSVTQSLAELEQLLPVGQGPDVRASMDPQIKLIKLAEYRTRLDGLMSQIQRRLEVRPGGGLSRRSSIAKVPEGILAAAAAEVAAASGSGGMGSATPCPRIAHNAPAGMGSFSAGDPAAAGSAAGPSSGAETPLQAVTPRGGPSAGSEGLQQDEEVVQERGLSQIHTRGASTTSLDDTWRLEEEIESLRAEVEAQYGAACEQKTTLKAVQLELDAVKHELDIRNSELLEARGQVLELQEMADQQDGMLLQQQSELQALDAELASRDSQLASLQGFKEEHETWFGEVQAYTQAIEKDCELLRTQLAEATEQAGVLTQQKREMAVQLTAVQEAETSYQTEIAGLKALLDGYQTRFGALEAERALHSMRGSGDPHVPEAVSPPFSEGPGTTATSATWNLQPHDSVTTEAASEEAAAVAAAAAGYSSPCASKLDSSGTTCIEVAAIASCGFPGPPGAAAAASP